MLIARRDGAGRSPAAPRAVLAVRGALRRPVRDPLADSVAGSVSWPVAGPVAGPIKAVAAPGDGRLTTGIPALIGIDDVADQPMAYDIGAREDREVHIFDA